MSVKRLIRDEKGQALLLALILLAVGALIITPLLGLMSTGLLTGEVYENKMYEQYAADAGVEDALQRLLNEEVDNITWPLFYYFTDPVNNKQVEVTIEPVWLLKGLSDLGLPDSEPAEGDPGYANDHWTVTGAISIENTASYIIDITADEPNAENVTVGHIGVWLPRGYSYVGGSTKINGVAVGDNPLVTNPGEPISHKGGTVLIWNFQGASFGALSAISPPPAGGGCTPAEKFPLSLRLSFDYATVGSDYVVMVYDAAGTFTAPAGVTNVTVGAWGGGGGGGARSSSSSGGAGGGGGGAYAKGTVSVTPGQTYTVMVGVGGAGGAPGNSPGSAGGNSWFGSQSTVLAKGGSGGAGGAGGAGGSGGSAAASVGSVKYSGGNGAAGSSYSSNSYRSGGGGGAAGNASAGGSASGTTGGAGGSEGGGNGADGRTNNGAGSSGSAPGGGGSGARRTSGGPYAGGAGGSGKVVLSYRAKEPQMAKGFFPWIKLADGRVAWDAEVGIFHITSRAASNLGMEKGTTVETYSLRSISRYAPGTGSAASALQGDYIAIGNTLMTSCWKPCSGSSCSYSLCSGPNCTCSCSYECRNYKVSESSATIIDVPGDAKVERAYLYWSAWRDSNNQPDRTAVLKVNSVPVTPTNPGDPAGTVVASRSYVQRNTATSPATYAYSCFADVTQQVKGSLSDGKIKDVTFTVGDVDCKPATGCAADKNTYAFAGWSLIVIYSSQAKDPHQLYLYDSDFWYAPDNSWHEFTLAGFEAPSKANDVDGRVTCFVVEGDNNPPFDTGEDLFFNGVKLTDSVNHSGNVWNSRSNVMGFTRSYVPGQPAGEISGLDLDTYSLSATQIAPGSTSAKVKATTGIDGWYMVYIMVSLRSTLVLGEGFEIGTLTYEIG